MTRDQPTAVELTSDVGRFDARTAQRSAKLDRLLGMEAVETSPHSRASAGHRDCDVRPWIGQFDGCVSAKGGAWTPAPRGRLSGNAPHSSELPHAKKHHLAESETPCGMAAPRPPHRAPKNRVVSAGSTSWACSTRCITPSGWRGRARPGCSRADRTAASPMAWIWTAIPALAARACMAPQRLGRLQEHAARTADRPAVGLPFVGLQEGRAAGAECSISEELQPADARPLWGVHG